MMVSKLKQKFVEHISNTSDVFSVHAGRDSVVSQTGQTACEQCTCIICSVTPVQTFAGADSDVCGGKEDTGLAARKNDVVNSFKTYLGYTALHLVCLQVVCCWHWRKLAGIEQQLLVPGHGVWHHLERSHYLLQARRQV